jgi:hypothetical protein
METSKLDVLFEYRRIAPGSASGADPISPEAR